MLIFWELESKPQEILYWSNKYYQWKQDKQHSNYLGDWDRKTIWDLPKQHSGTHSEGKEGGGEGRKGTECVLHMWETLGLIPSITPTQREGRWRKSREREKPSKLEIWNQDINRIILPLKPVGKNASLHLFCFLLEILDVPLACRYTILFCFHRHMATFFLSHFFL